MKVLWVQIIEFILYTYFKSNFYLAIQIHVKIYFNPHHE